MEREKEMGHELDEFAKDLQQKIYDETRKTYGEVVFQRWMNPVYMGRLEKADGHGRITGMCGDTMEIFLRFEEDRVKQAGFLTDGCGTSLVCGSYAAELAHGKNPDEITEITGEKILSILGNLPGEERHCAFLASETLQKALADYMRKTRRIKE